VGEGDREIRLAGSAGTVRVGDGDHQLTAEVTVTPPHSDAMRLTVTADRSEVEASDLGLSLN